MRRERAQLVRNGLLIADIGKNAVRQRKHGSLSWHGNAGLGHQCKQPDSLENNRLSTRVGSADHQNALISGQIEFQWHGHLVALPHPVFEQGVPGSDQHDFAI